MNSIQELTETMLVRFTQIDYSREMALIAVTAEQGRKSNWVWRATPSTRTATLASSRW